MRIQNSTALVTGANRGLGAAFATALLERGVAHLYTAVRDAAGLAMLSRDPRVTPLVLDITDDQQLAAAAARVSRLDLLINNAGVLASGDLLHDDLARVRRDMEVNFFGTLHATRAFLPQLEAAGGAVVNVLTLVALASLATMGGYSASKAAAASMTQALRTQLAPHGVSVHGVFPGAIDTDMIRDLAIPKTPPIEVAHGALGALEAGEVDIFPDPMARQLRDIWQANPKALEATFASMGAGG